MASSATGIITNQSVRGKSTIGFTLFLFFGYSDAPSAAQPAMVRTSVPPATYFEMLFPAFATSIYSRPPVTKLVTGAV